MGRKIGASLVAMATFFAISTTALAASVSITPAAGSQADEFLVEGADLPPGLALDINFVSPEGTVFSTAAVGKVVVVDPDGTFELSVMPATDFAGASAGTWTVQVCTSGTDDCVQTTFDIAL